MPATLPEILEMPRYKGKGGMEALERIFKAEMLFDQKLAAAAKKFGISNITARRWHVMWRRGIK